MGIQEKVIDNIKERFKLTSSFSTSTNLDKDGEESTVLSNKKCRKDTYSQ